MTGKRVVVPFERPAAYWQGRARRHDTPDKRPAAARMLRKALEKTGDPATALELARVYLDMGSFTAAERCLARAVARGGLTGDACFLIGCCALNRGDESLAEDAFDACQRLDPDGECADRAQDLLEGMPWGREKRGKRRARSETLCRRAREALFLGRREDAGRLIERAWQKGKTAEAALLMGAVRPPRRALPYFLYAAGKTPMALQPHLLSAVAASHAGKARVAREALDRAEKLCESITDFEEFCSAAWEAGAGQAALSAVNRQLENAPASIDFLRLKYLCLKRAGEEESARRTLETLLDLDPDDAAGLWYRRHPEDLRLYEGRRVLLSALGFQLRAVPERIRYGRLNRLLHYLVMALRDDAEAEEIYRIVPPLWRRMPEAEKRFCDGEKQHYPLCLALYILAATGRRERAEELFRFARGKRRIRRTLRRFAQWMNEEEEKRALHQF